MAYEENPSFEPYGPKYWGEPCPPYVTWTTNKAVLYPCDRGGSSERGYHNFSAGATGIVVCTYCGKKSNA